MRYNKTWTLFLDRDGVINERLPGGYVKHPDEFVFRSGVPEAIARLSTVFGRIVVVTNQQGIGKRMMTVADLDTVHEFMKEQVAAVGGKIDGVYFCPDLSSKYYNCRKPKPAMGEWAKKDFPEIEFSRSVMVGDSISDLQFGRNLNMHTILITSKEDEAELWEKHKADWDEQFPGVKEWVEDLFTQ